ncbi:MAG: ATP-binding protein [Ignavibacteria bacterium]|nr:ATP-binding protein [Ignavibacteria bacterium]
MSHDSKIEYNRNFIRELKEILNNIQYILMTRKSLVEILSKLENKINALRFLIGVKKLTNNNYYGTIYHFENLTKVPEEYFEEFKSIVALLEKYVNECEERFIQLNDRIYIPTLRTSYNLYQSEIHERRIISKISGDILEISAIKNYCLNLIGSDSIPQKDIVQMEVFSGMSLYDTVQAHNNSDSDMRERLRLFEAFLSATFFNKSLVTITAYKPSNYTPSQKYRDECLILKVDKTEHEIHNFGDGINNIIILLYRLFTCEEYSWVFIEEPEIGLHPAFQRIFVETVLNNKVLQKKKLKIFITTHSNHILDLSLENSQKTSLFTFERILKENEELFKIENVSSGDLKILNLLGINNSSIFLANCSVWVEGITDRKYLKVYLDAYMNSYEFEKKKLKKYLEDVHYCFFEYAGSNLVHYIFKNENKEENSIDSQIRAKFLSNRIFLLADKDKGKAKKHIKLISQQNINFRYKLTSGKEIENLISEDLLKIILPELNNQISATDSEITKIKEKDYKDVGLGKYLQTLFKAKGIKFSAPSGTLSEYYKERMPEIVSKYITWDNMGNDAKKLIKLVYKFIDDCNNHRNENN